MATQRENALQKRIQVGLKKRFKNKLWIVKYHGDEMARAGVPDLIGCAFGYYFAIEVKMPGKKTSPLQDEEIADIKTAKGIAFVATSVDEAISRLEKRLKAKGVNIYGTK